MRADAIIAPMRVRFTKMQGAGNDFVVLDATREPLALEPGADASRLADRRFGVGADQILVVEKRGTARRRLRLPHLQRRQRRRGRACGNGARCFVRFVRDKRPDRQDDAGRRDHEPPPRAAPAGRRPRHRRHGPARLRPGARAVRHHLARAARAPMPACRSGRSSSATAAAVELAVVSMGNPHAVQIVADVDAAPVATLGPAHREARALRATASTPASCRSSSRARDPPARLRARRRRDARLRHRRVRRRRRRHPARPARSRRSTSRRAAARLTIEWPGGDAPMLMTGPAETVFEGEIEL